MNPNEQPLRRRDFLSGTSAAGVALTAAALVKAADAPAAPKTGPAIKVALIGCGGRGSWIANLFQKHGGYKFVAVADYFQGVADAAGASLGVDKAKCFSGLSGYKRAIESGAEAVVLETPPYFFPEHAAAAVEAGLHVYMAKPVAVDVPGTLKVGAAGKAATAKQRVFLVDYQMPTDPMNIEVRKRIQAGGLGTLGMVLSAGKFGEGGFGDPPLTKNLESRLRGLVWVNDDELGCGYLGNFDIHVIDALVWALGRRPVSAYGRGGRFRKNPQGNALDSYCVTYAMADGLTWNHQSLIIPSLDWPNAGALEGSIHGSAASARLAYWGAAHVRGGPKHFGGGPVVNLYEAGAMRNIATFYENVKAGRFANETAQRTVDCTLTCILGREAARRGTFLTMDELLRENKRLEVDLKGLKA